MSNTQSKPEMSLEALQPSYLEIQKEDWVKDLLDKLSIEEQHVVLDALKDMKRFNCKKFSSSR